MLHHFIFLGLNLVHLVYDSGEKIQYFRVQHNVKQYVRFEQRRSMCEPTSYCLNTGSYFIVYMVHGMLLLCNEWKEDPRTF